MVVIVGCEGLPANMATPKDQGRSREEEADKYSNNRGWLLERVQV